MHFTDHSVRDEDDDSPLVTNLDPHYVGSRDRFCPSVNLINNTFQRGRIYM